MYLKDTDVAKRLNISRPTLWRWVSKPEMRFPKPVKFGRGCTRWKLSEVEAWEAACEKQKGVA